MLFYLGISRQWYLDFSRWNLGSKNYALCWQESMNAKIVKIKVFSFVLGWNVVAKLKAFFQHCYLCQCILSFYHSTAVALYFYNTDLLVLLQVKHPLKRALRLWTSQNDRKHSVSDISVQLFLALWRSKYARNFIEIYHKFIQIIPN